MTLTDRQVYVFHKTVHAIAGIALATLVNHLGNPYMGIASAWLLGIAKEIYDQNSGGSFGAGDVAWTGAPATVVLMLWGF